MKKKSLSLNMALSVIKGVMAVAFPLITFPYVSKILEADNIGKYNFAASIVNYFILIENLGISDYALREGAYVRDDKKKFTKFANEVETINLLGLIISYCLLCISIFFVSKFQAYLNLIIILSVQILFKPLAMDWINGVYEDFVFITIRSILIQLISLVCLFAFVKDSDDVAIYAFITSGVCILTSVFNLRNIRKYYHLRFTKKPNLKKHLKPMALIFATSLAATIYINSDITILGFFGTDTDVGIYSVSTKIYSVVKAVIYAALIVFVPRLSAYLGEEKKEEYRSLAINVYEMIITFVLPAIIGIVLLSKEIVLIISDSSYIEARYSLMILSAALISSIGSWFWSYCVLVPNRQESFVFKATIISATINLILNLILIPFGKGNAAAFTTVISEICCFVMVAHAGKKEVVLTGIKSTVQKTAIGCLGIVATRFVLVQFKLPMIVDTIVTIICSIIIYFILEVMVRNSVVLSVIDNVKRKVKEIEK